MRKLSFLPILLCSAVVSYGQVGIRPPENKHIDSLLNKVYPGMRSYLQTPNLDRYRAYGSSGHPEIKIDDKVYKMPNVWRKNGANDRGMIFNPPGAKNAL